MSDDLDAVAEGDDIDSAAEGDDFDPVAEGDDEASDADDERDDDIAPSATDVLEYLVKAVVDDPAAVRVDVDDHGRRPSLNVTVGDGDMGRVIGKRGRVAQSIRTVTRAAAARDGVEIDIEFLD